MKTAILLTFATLMISTMVFAQQISDQAQSQTDSVEIKKVLGGYQFYHEGQQLKFKQLENLLKSNEQAYQQIKSSKSSRVIATILGSAGGFMIGWPLGTAIAGGKPNWTIAGIGAGLTAISVPISIGSNKKLKRGVAAYNAAL